MCNYSKWTIGKKQQNFILLTLYKYVYIGLYCPLFTVVCFSNRLLLNNKQMSVKLENGIDGNLPVTSEQEQKRNAEIDRLTREHIASEMKVPATMVSTSTDLYKKVYSEMSAKVPVDFDTKKAELNKKFEESYNDSQENKRLNFYNSTFSEKPYIDSDDESDVSDKGDSWEEVKLNKKPKSTYKISNVNSNTGNNKFSVKGVDVDKKIHWLDLPTDSDLEKYSDINDVCKCLVNVYKKRYQQVKDQLVELKSIVDDIDKYSNYND